MTPSRWFPLRPRSDVRWRLAWAVAVALDAAQLALAPMTVEGGFSPVDDGLDLLGMVLLTLLVGWHWAFLPSFVTKLIPFVDLTPTWSLATWAGYRKAGQLKKP